MPQNLPFTLAVAPFPEGFQGDMDEVFQQAYQNTSGVVTGSFITGLVLPPNSTLPTSDQGPIAMNETWYFWDTASGQYLAQTSPFKTAKNFVRNCCYQVQQLGSTFTLGAGITPTYDLALARSTAGNILSISTDVGPVAGGDNDLVPSAIKYTVGPTLVPTLGTTDLYSHEHLLEGSDIIMLQGQQMSLSFSIYATVAGTYSVYLTSNGRDSSFVANFTLSANTWTRVKIINIPPFPTTGTWNYSEGVTGLYIGIAMGVGSQWQTATLNTWRAGFFAGSTSNVNMLTVVNNQIKITGVKLEAAPGASYLQVPAFQADFEEMQRYYYTTFDYQSTTSGIPVLSSSYSSANVLFAGTFPRRMCKIPTVVPYGWTSHAAGNITDISTGTDTACASLAGARKGFAAIPAVSATKGDVFAAIIRADARIS